MRAAAVLLSDIRVGDLADVDETLSFRFRDSYRALPNRPVLSQRFEDDLFRVYRGSKGQLPAFFANLVPEEGPLRRLLERRLGVTPQDDFGLLLAVGQDLPGAITISPSEDVERLNGATLLDEEEVPTGSVNGDGLRFSLAGVQMKFSMSSQADKLTLPAKDERGQWIAKFPSSEFPLLTRNEFATMEWARASGFEVPDCVLREASSIPTSLTPYVIRGEPVLAVKRFDREDQKRIHQEDFAQVVGYYPRLKYESSYDKCAVLARAICGDDGYFEFVKRLAFAIGSGNADAHLKNWSLLYPDGVTARWTPLYDQVSTVAWPAVRSELALKFVGDRRWTGINIDSFAKLAKKIGADPKSTMETVEAVLAQSRVAWTRHRISRLYPGEHVRALQKHWSTIPLLRHFGRLDD